MKIHIDTVVSSPDAELPKAEKDHEYTISKTTIEEPRIGLFELWRIKRFIEKSYILLNEKRILDKINKQKDAKTSKKA